MDEHDPESCCTIFTFWRSKTSEPATTDAHVQIRQRDWQ